jgi:hypothetical protein
MKLIPIIILLLTGINSQEDVALKIQLNPPEETNTIGMIVLK